MGAGDVGVAVELFLGPRGDLARALVDREGDVVPLGTDGALRPVELNVPPGPPSSGPG